MGTATFRARARSGALGLVPVATFFALAFLLSWVWWVPLALIGQTVARGVVSPSHVPGLLGPMVATLVTATLLQGRAGASDLLARMTRWRVGWRWWLVGLSPLAFFAVAAPVARLVDGAGPEWREYDRMNGFPAIGVLAPVAGATAPSPDPGARAAARRS
jgi:hypothetical protein